MSGIVGLFDFDRDYPVRDDLGRMVDGRACFGQDAGAPGSMAWLSQGS